MRWSWTVGKLAGIELRIHATFLLILAWVGVIHWQQDGGMQGALEGIFFILALFGCVVLHELGHALAARRYGISTKDITLLPIGGVARLERMPEDPREELVVALAGPAVNVVIAAVLFVMLTATSSWTPVEQLNVTQGSFAERLMVVNVFLVLFNLLPAFPMDGGRVLRALLATRMGYLRATQIAAVIGQGMALLFGFVGLLFNPFLIFIALFVWIGAAQEASGVQIRSAIGGVPVTQAMLTEFHTLNSGDSLDRAIDLLLAGSQQDFPVIDESGQVLGVLTRADLFSALASKSLATVDAVMRKDVGSVNAGDMLEVAFQKIQATGGRTMPVMREGRLVGLVTAENLGEFLMVQSARGGAHPAHRTGESTAW